MPGIAPLPPSAVRLLLESQGYSIIEEGPDNWLFAKGTDDTPVVVPHNVDLLPVAVSMNIASRVGFDVYLFMLSVVRTLETSAPTS